ncbi:MAG TPA: phage holin family protein, partial [Propionibacteriaceae bacterium]|nr:phage holin family protein [Propionibacteriaceae bacterium]
MMALPAVWSYALGFLTVAVLFFVVAAVLALLGKDRFKMSGPNRTIAEGEQSIAAVKTAVDRGQANVAAMTPANARPELVGQDPSR